MANVVPIAKFVPSADWTLAVPFALKLITCGLACALEMIVEPIALPLPSADQMVCAAAPPWSASRLAMAVASDE